MATPRAEPWRTALPVAVAVVLALLALYFDTARKMVEIWARSDTFMHGFVVVPISLWLIWRRRAEVAALTPRPWPWALLPMAVAAAAWLAAGAAGVENVAQFALVAMVAFAVPAVLGREVGRMLMFPLAFLAFAVPFGEFMLPTMMESTADFAVSALRATGVPVYREGLQFVIPSGSWSVVEECSGVRYLIASFMVGTLYAYLNYQTRGKRIAFVVASLAVPIVANWLRAYMIVMLGHLSGNKLAAGVDHILYGWVFFGLVMGGMYFVGARWADPDPVPEPVPPQPAGSERGAAAWVAPAALVLLLAAAPVLALRGITSAEAGAAAPQLVLPVQLSEHWRAVEQQPDYKPSFLNPSLELDRLYRSAGGDVALHLAYYRQQGQDRKLVSSTNHLVHSNDPSWNLVSRSHDSADTAAGPQAVRTADVLRKLRTAGQRGQLLVWQLYWVDGRFVAEDAQAKLIGAVSRLRGHGDDGAAITLVTEVDTPEAARARLAAFLKDNLPPLQQLLEDTRRRR